jgi:hypothetical protein
MRATASAVAVKSVIRFMPSVHALRSSGSLTLGPALAAPP